MQNAQLPVVLALDKKIPFTKTFTENFGGIEPIQEGNNQKLQEQACLLRDSSLDSGDNITAMIINVAALGSGRQDMAPAQTGFANPIATVEPTASISSTPVRPALIEVPTATVLPAQIIPVSIAETATATVIAPKESDEVKSATLPEGHEKPIAVSTSLSSPALLGIGALVASGAICYCVYNYWYGEKNDDQEAERQSPISDADSAA